MPFRFQYQKVLEVKQVKKELASVEASRRLLKVQEAQHRVDTLNHQYRSTRDEMRLKLEEGEIQAAQLSGYSGYLFMLERHIRLAMGDLDNAKAYHRESLKLVVAAKQQEEIFQKLKERHQADWKKDEERRDTALLDEVGGVRHFRRQAASNG